MKIDVKHIAELSRIALTEKELKEFTPQMESILESATVLQKIDCAGVEPMKEHIKFSSLRKDHASPSLRRRRTLRNVKHIENGLVKIYGEVFGEKES